MWGKFSPRSAAPDHPSLAVRKFPGQARRARQIHVIEHLAPDNTACVYNPDICTLERGIKERVYYVKSGGGWALAPLPVPKLFSKRLRSFEGLLGKHLPSTTPVSRQEFVDMYQGRRHVVYQAALDSLMTIGVSKRDAKVKAFVKAEKGKLGSAPRVIQPRDPRYNIEVGKYLKPTEERMYKAIARVYGDRTVMKGLNARGVASNMLRKWNNFSKPVAVGLDASRFDQHVSVDALKWEHKQWIKCFRNPDHKRELTKLLSWQLRSKGVGYCKDGKLKYSVEGKRMSGDMNTGSGNCLLMCAMIYAYSEHKNVRVKLANNGDDCVVFMESKDYTRFSDGLQQWFLELGFSMTVEPPVYDFERIEFCQAKPIFDGTEYTMVRNIRAFTKDACVLVPIESTKTLASWLGAVGDAGMSLTGGIPIWQEFYSVMQRSAGDASSPRRRSGAKFLNQSAFETGMMMSAKGMSRVYGEVSARARYSFWLAFGIIPDHQVALEIQYSTYPNIQLVPELASSEYVTPLCCRGFKYAY